MGHFVVPERIVAYIDGFNLHFGLQDSGFERYSCLDLWLLMLHIIKPGQELVGVKYFTSLVTNAAEDRAMQKAYLSRIARTPMLNIVYGKFKKVRYRCPHCGQPHYRYVEKMTDENITTHILSDYFTGQFDTAILISGDVDLLPPIRLINDSGTHKRVFVAFPPGRVNDEVRKHARGSMVIGRKMLADSQLPPVSG